MPIIYKSHPTQETQKEIKSVPTNIPSKNIYYKNNIFRSKLEYRWARFFEKMDWSWEYEPMQYFQYLKSLWIPDFALQLSDTRLILIEIKPLASLSNWLDKEYLHKRKNIQNAFLHLQQETNIECSVMILGSEPFLYWSSDNNNDKQLGLSIHNETFEHATENDWKYSYVNFICAKNEINKSFGISETVNQHLNKQIIYPNNGQHYYVDANKQGNINFTQKDIDIVTTRNRPSEVNYITQQYNA